jgi:hypothetical protein
MKLDFSKLAKEPPGGVSNRVSPDVVIAGAQAKDGSKGYQWIVCSQV